MASTYTPIATTTLGSAQASYTFSSIPSTYTDLVLVANVTLSSSGTNLECRINGDTGANYSMTGVYGTGGSALSVRQSNAASMLIDYYSDPNTTIALYRINFMGYSNATTYKTVISRADNSSPGPEGAVGLWRSNAAINQIQLFVGSSLTFAAGSTFTLWGILNA